MVSRGRAVRPHRAAAPCGRAVRLRPVAARHSGTRSKARRPRRPHPEGDPMDQQERLAAEQACISLITAYTHCADGFQERAAIVDLFTDDGIWESDEARLEGRDALLRFFGDAAA